MSIRIGEGLDRHRLAAGRELWLGGVRVEHTHGLLGHSDGDVALHALCNALLGALALGDLGQHFADSDPRHRNRASSDFVQAVIARVHAAGYRLGNADLTIMAEAPMLAPHASTMRARIAQLCEVGVDRISVKATRGEGVGPEGRAEAISAHAVVLLFAQEAA
jgi:2-C-methyl-D-erythritol 2,4-cyclodiphosphate synthase